MKQCLISGCEFSAELVKIRELFEDLEVPEGIMEYAVAEPEGVTELVKWLLEEKND